MTEEAKVRRVYRLCPCNAMDIEGMQTWLEDMAAEGLLLEKDSIFCGFWSFIKTNPQKMIYRLEVAARGGIFSDSTDTPREDILETAEAMGWEYVTRYKFFYIYCSSDLQAVPLNTDPEIQAITIKRLKRERRNELIWELVYIAILILLGSNNRYFMLSAVTISPLFSLAFLGIFLLFAITPLMHLVYLRQYEKRLKDGGNLDQRKNWHRHSRLIPAGKCLPTVLVIVLLICLGQSFLQASDKTPLAELEGSLPFAAAQDIFPDGKISGSLDMWDYGTYTQWDTLISENIEWREACDITTNRETYHATMHITSHTTASDWIARWLFKDYYRYDSQRYHGKRFEDQEAPNVSVDALNIYNSYGTQYILLRQGNIVIHASVSLRQSDAPNAWEHWLNATLDKLSASVP